jgi:hypothetical protein
VTVKKEVKDTGDGLSAKIDSVNNSLNKRLDDVLLALAQKSATEAHSPRKLNVEGERILNESGVRKVVEERLDALLNEVQARQPANAYQVERYLVEAVQHLYNDEEVKESLEEGAFASGTNVFTMLYVGAIFIRDRILSELGMSPEDIDKHDPKQSKNSKSKN